jgi:hypothetical protein
VRCGATRRGLDQTQHGHGHGVTMRRGGGAVRAARGRREERGRELRWAGRLGWMREAGVARKLGQARFRPKTTRSLEMVFLFYLDSIQTNLIRFQMISKRIRKLKHSTI